MCGMHCLESRIMDARGLIMDTLLAQILVVGLSVCRLARTCASHLSFRSAAGDRRDGSAVPAGGCTHFW